MEYIYSHLRRFKVNNSYSAKLVYSFIIHKKGSNSGLFLPFFDAEKGQNNDAEMAFIYFISSKKTNILSIMFNYFKKKF